MNVNTIGTPWGLALSALGLALLAGCGGGGGDPVVSDGPTADLAMAASVSTACGVQLPPETTSVGSGYELGPSQNLQQEGMSDLFSSVMSPGGYNNGGETMSLSVPLADMRETPYQNFNPAQTGDTMGIEMASSFLPGSVGCIKSVVRVVNSGTEATPSYLLSLKSETVSPLPLDGIPEHKISGFEFVSNFPAANAMAVFRLGKEHLGSADGVKICHVASTSSWDCASPDVIPNDTQWIFQRTLSASGVYVLSAPREEVPLE